MIGDWLAAVVAAPVIAAEAVSDLLFAAGAQGLWEDSPDELGRPVFKAAFPPGHEMRLMAELPDSLRRTALALDLEPTDFSLELEHRPTEDWSETWKADLRPIVIDEALMIVPSWLEVPPKPTQETKILRLDPGSAFGSGRHQTTAMCLKILCDASRSNQRPKNVLDLGSGSGVLALAAAALLPEAAVTAVDSDPSTIFAANGNMELNGLTKRIDLSLTPLTELPGGYDLILANLTRNDLVALAREMAEKSSPDGRLILSGVLDEQVPDVLEAFQTEGFEKTLHLGRDEWAALALARRKTSSESEESDDPAAPDVRSSKNFDELPNPSGEPRDAENREDEDGR